MMEEKEILQNLKKLSQITLKSSEKERIFSLIEKRINNYRQKRAFGVTFLTSFVKNKISLAFACFLIFIFSSFALAKDALPDSPFYSLKTFAQEVKIAFTKKENKSQMKALVLQERLNDLKKVKNLEDERVKKLVASLKNDLQSLPEEISQNPKKKEVLEISQNIQKTTQKLKEEIKTIPSPVKDQLETVVKETDQKIFSLIVDTQEQINNCPVYLLKNLDELRTYFEKEENLKNLTPKKVLEIKATLAEIESLIKAGDCLGALEKIESLSQFKSIHSLEGPFLDKDSVENSSPESLDK